MKLNELNAEELLQRYNELMEELRERKLVRSSNNPVSDYAEKIVSEMLHLTLQKGSNKGYDAIDEKTKMRYQIKSRRFTKHNHSRQLGVIRNLDQHPFDCLIAVIFNENFEPKEIWQISSEIISEHSKFSEHQNGHILILRGNILTAKEVKRIV